MKLWGDPPSPTLTKIIYFVDCQVHFRQCSPGTCRNRFIIYRTDARHWNTFTLTKRKRKRSGHHPRNCSSASNLFSVCRRDRLGSSVVFKDTVSSLSDLISFCWFGFSFLCLETIADSIIMSGSSVFREPSSKVSKSELSRASGDMFSNNCWSSARHLWTRYSCVLTLYEIPGRTQTSSEQIHLYKDNERAISV